MYHRNSDLPLPVRQVLNRRGQGAWRLIYNQAVKDGLCEFNARSKAWRAVQKQRGCTSCGQGRAFFN